jgi:hypothetical protein
LVIDVEPDDTIRGVWNMIILLTMVAVIVLVPLYVAFVTEQKPFTSHPLGIILFVIDITFGIDMYMATRMAYKDDRGANVADRWRITQEYLCSWFVVDLVAIFPLDLILSGYRSDWAPLLQGAKLLKFARLLRCGATCDPYAIWCAW